jgi:hypothetical protein
VVVVVDILLVAPVAQAVLAVEALLLLVLVALELQDKVILEVLE